MPRCIFCDEWAGPNSDQHPECAAEFARQMRRPGLTRRIFTRLRDLAQTVVTLVFGSAARTR